MNAYDRLAQFLGPNSRNPSIPRDQRICSSIRSTFVRRLPELEAIGVFYHGTCVVRAHPDGSVVLNTGGYYTATTKARINEYSPASVFQDKGVWYVTGRAADGGCDHSKAARVKFYDGIRVDADGRVLALGEPVI